MVIFSPLAIDIFLPALPVMALDFSAAINEMQWGVGVFLFSLGVGQLLSGPLSDRFGRRPVALGGVIIYGLSSLFAATSTNLEFFLLWRIVQGLGACAIVVAAFASVRDKYDALQSGVIYSYLSGIICCVPAIAPLLGGILTEQWGWRSNFYVMFGYAVIAGIIILIGLPETRPANIQRPKRLLSFSQFLPVLKHPVFQFNVLAVMLAMSVILAFVSSAPAWIMIELGQSQHTFVFWFSLNAVLNIAVYFIAPKVLLKFGVQKTVGLAFFLLLSAGALMLLLLPWNTVSAFMLPVMLGCTGISLFMGACSAQALSPFGHNAGTASALLGFIQMSGAAVVVFLLQLVPVSIPEQFALMVAVFIPLYVIWHRPKVTRVLYP